MRLSRSHLPAIAQCLGLLCFCAGALAWQASSPFRATVHEHVFTHMAVESSGCVVQTEVRFEAPKQAYESEYEVRNHYRFKARVRFAGGKQVLSPIFSSSSAAKRRYTFRSDTSSEGCWAKERQKLVDIDVEGCRGKGCHVEPFKR
jgi:hypothetical protein